MALAENERRAEGDGPLDDAGVDAEAELLAEPGRVLPRDGEGGLFAGLVDLDPGEQVGHVAVAADQVVVFPTGQNPDQPHAAAADHRAEQGLIGAAAGALQEGADPVETEDQSAAITTPFSRRANGPRVRCCGPVPLHRLRHDGGEDRLQAGPAVLRADVLTVDPEEPAAVQGRSLAGGGQSRQLPDERRLADTFAAGQQQMAALSPMERT